MHIIRKQTVELAVTGPESMGLHWQGQLANFAREVLPGHLERLFDQAAPPGMVLRVDKLDVELDLDMGVVEKEGLMLEAIMSKVSETLASQPKQNEDVENMSGTSPVESYRLTEGQSAIGLLLFFLENGQLPWYASQSIRLDFEGALLAAFKVEKLGSNWQRAFQKLMESMVARQRLVWQFSEAVLAGLASCFFSIKKAEIAKNQKPVMLLAKALPNGAEALKEAFWEVFFEKPVPRATLAMEALQRFLLKNPTQKAAVKKAITTSGEIALAQALEDMEVTEPPPLTSQKTALPLAQEGIFVDNAGLVLLHPFLPTFFKELSIAEQGKITDPHRAIHLLQYLAAGQATPPEHLLSLNKLLCGLPLEEPIKRRVRLRKREKAEAKNLLEAVIKHWPALGDSSVENLQGSFLCREGKLTHIPEKGWVLQVAGMAWDILLNTLPWGISTIKLPWMEEILWVEWV